MKHNDNQKFFKEIYKLLKNFEKRKEKKIITIKI